MDDFCDLGQTKPKAICQTCGSDWSALVFNKDCAECGGGHLQIPCLVCSGTCGAMWQRAVIDSNDSGQAHWVGRCYHQTDRYAEGDGPPQPTQRYLFRFGYHNQEQLRLNALFNDDAECSEWIFIEAASKRQAAEWGRLYADLFVAKLFKTRIGDVKRDAYLWSQAGFAEWIEEDIEAIAQAEAAKIRVIRQAGDILAVLQD